jgi:hypothetical protein
MMEAVRTSETSVDNHFTRQYNPEDNSEHHTRRRENLKSHKCKYVSCSVEVGMKLLNIETPVTRNFIPQILLSVQDFYFHKVGYTSYVEGILELRQSIDSV